jgi:Ca2+-binding EF-hand superfamily protein
MQRQSIVGVLLIVAAVVTWPSSASAQSDWVRRLDANNNGYIEPSEISDRARPYLERFAGDYGIDLTRPISLRRLEEAASRYYERRSRESAEKSPPEINSTVKGFGPEPERTLIPDFGSPQVKYPYTQADLDQADETLGRYDRDKDGFLDRSEIEQARWRGASPSESDLDRDGRLSRLELAQRYARVRLMERQSAISLQASAIPAAADTVASSSQTDRSVDSSRRYDRRSRSADRGSRSLATSIIERYDLNKNDVLEPRELASAGIDVGKADYNRDGLVDRYELAEYLFLEMEAAGNDLSELLPTWFFERDRNNDGQIEMSEFTDEWSTEKAKEFASYDSNGDGIITPDELLTSKRLVGGNFANQEAKILLPRSTVVSEIQVDEEIIIGDLNVQLSITHTFAEQLDGYLIGPDGQRIELFSRVGGSDDHFDRTIFDDEAGTNITRARPPFRGNFQPGAVAKRQPGLSSYKGKSLKGIWQLMIRSSRSDRSGVLHDWSLIVEPSQDSIDRLND